MQEYIINDRRYRLAGNLTAFQRDLYVHLVDWKRKHLTEECGHYRHKGKMIPYDVLLPEGLQKELQPLYRPAVGRVRDHQRHFPFKLHKFVGHMASSQAACINLFVPLLSDPETAAQVLRKLKPDLLAIATDQLDCGFQIEFWPGKGREPGPLNDHTIAAGTDADVAIAYRDTAGRLKLWIIEHKLTEKEFTTCGGAESRGRSEVHRCSPTAELLRDHNLCYYHEHCGYAYWNITDRHPDVFPRDRLAAHEVCPFKGGTNQLWRNMLLALAVEDAPGSLYSGVHFSVVHHPDNRALEASMVDFKKLLGCSDRFSSFTSAQIVNNAAIASAPRLREWAAWYKELYRV